MNQIDVFYCFVHLHDVAASESEAFLGDERFKNGEDEVRGPKIIGMRLVIFEFTAQNRDLVAFFSELLRETVASSRGSVVQFIGAFEDKKNFHRVLRAKLYPLNPAETNYQPIASDSASRFFGFFR